MNLIELYKKQVSQDIENLKFGDMIYILSKSCGINTIDVTLNVPYIVMKTDKCKCYESKNYCDGCKSRGVAIHIIDDTGTRCVLCEATIGDKNGREYK